MNTTDNRHGSATVTLPSDREILITRQFDAPAALVFKAWTTPELVKRWWGFDTSEWLVCEIDLRVGGSWRYVTRETKAASRSASTASTARSRRRIASSRPRCTRASPTPRRAQHDRLRGARRRDDDDHHRRSTHARSTATRHIASGMEGGMQISMNRLEDVVVELDRAA